jgi:hypothetical protein
MPEGVKTDSNAGHVELISENLQIPQHVALNLLSTLQRGEDQGKFMPSKPTVQDLAEFKWHRNHAMFFAFALYRHKQILQIELRPLQAQSFVNPNAGVQKAEPPTHATEIPRRFLP